MQKFDEGERLYHRVLLTQAEFPLPFQFRFPDFSVNRGAFSEPEDVLIGFGPEYGVACFCVRDIPTELPQAEADVKYTFRPVHVPEEHNYAHSEVRTFKNGVYRADLRIKNEAVKAKFRAMLSDRAQVLPPRGNTNQNASIPLAGA